MTLLILDDSGLGHRHRIDCERCPLRIAEIVQTAVLEHAEASLWDGDTVVALCYRNAQPWIKLPGANQ